MVEQFKVDEGCRNCVLSTHKIFRCSLIQPNSDKELDATKSIKNDMKTYLRHLDLKKEWWPDAAWNRKKMKALRDLTPIKTCSGRCEDLAMQCRRYNTGVPSLSRNIGIGVPALPGLPGSDRLRAKCFEFRHNLKYLGTASEQQRETLYEKYVPDKYPLLLIMVLVFVEQHCIVRAQINVIDEEETSIETQSVSNQDRRIDNTTRDTSDLSTEDGEWLEGTTGNPCRTDLEADDTNSTKPESCVEITTVKKPKKSVKTDYVGYVAIPLFLVLGLFGNSMTVIVMSSQRFRKATCSLILIFLSCSDTALILMQPWNKPWIISMLGVDIRALSEIGCKLFFIFRRTAKMSSSWLVVFVCFERFVAVCFPLRTKLICTKRNTIIGIVSVYAVMFSYTGAWSIFSKITASGKCVPYFVEAGSAALGRAFLVVGTSLYAVIPTILLLIMTPIIVHRLFVQRKKRKEMTQSAEAKSDDTFRITVMLLGITTAYIVLVSPIWLGHNVAFARGETLFQSHDPVLVIFRQVAQPMEQLNYSINFFLYVLCSKSFRQHVSKLLGCGRLAKRKSGSATMSAHKQVPNTNETRLTGSSGALENSNSRNFEELTEAKESPGDEANRV